MTWTYVMDETALPEGSMAPVYPLGINVVIARVGGMVSGTLSGHTLTCSCHDWRFDIRTGRFLDAAELGLAVYPARSEEGKLFVSVG
jgi:hypothetical protein